MITALEVSISYIDIGTIFLPLLLVLMVIKFVVVVGFFMHLRFDNPLFSFVFFSGAIARDLRVLRRPGHLHIFVVARSSLPG